MYEIYRIEFVDPNRESSKKIFDIYLKQKYEIYRIEC